MPGIYTDGTYLDRNPTWHEEDSRWKATQIVRMIERNHLTPASVCEIGCGAGEVLRQLSEKLPAATRFYGYEISPQAFEICRTKSKDNLLYRHQDLFEETETFDLVLAIDVFEHVEDYFAFLRRLKARGRYKLFHIPLDMCVQGVLRRTPILRARKTMGHLHYFMKETALATLEELGYEVVDYTYTAGSLEVPNRPLRTRLLSIPRKLLFALNRDLAVRLLGGFSLLVLAR